MADRRVVLVSGASRGLGYALARAAAARDAHVLALARTQSHLDALADEIEAGDKGAITVIPGDITDPPAMAYMAGSIYDRFKRIDNWFHTAWYTAPMQPIAHLTGSDVDKSLAVNIRATAHLIHVIAPVMQNTPDARAVFFDDTSVLKSNQGNYAFSKAAQMTIARNWQIEARQIGPKVDILTPPPFAGALRSTLYPGIEKSSLPTPQSVADGIIDDLF